MNRQQVRQSSRREGTRTERAHALYNGANAAARAGDLATAIAGYRKALTMMPTLQPAQANLVRALLRAGAGGEALEVAARALPHVDGPELRRLFVRAAAAARRTLSALERGLLVRAFDEGWGRMPEVALAAAATLQADLAADADPASLGRNGLLLAHLRSAPIANEALELGLNTVRERLVLGGGGDPALLGGLAQQGFINEYVWAVSPAAGRAVAALRERLAAADRPAAADLLRFAMFEPVHNLPRAEAWLDQDWPAPAAAVLRQQVAETREERALRGSITVLTPIADTVSEAVRAQYEENPYPRWVVPDQVEATTLEAFLRRALPGGGFAVQVPAGFAMLIAGCGTGQHSLTAARRFPEAQITAIDLSLASLAYATRRTRAAGASIEFAQADILALGGWSKRFDVIDATGVLHHLGDPVAGWRVLAGLLSPGGFMRVGLYSRLGRQHVTSAQRAIREKGLWGDVIGLREMLRAQPMGSEAQTVTESYDFYTASTCRDLLMHVQEHAFDLVEIKTALKELGLRFLGFDLPDGVLPRFQQLFGSTTDLDAWAAFETDNPRIFTGMYQFWVTRR